MLPKPSSVKKGGPVFGLPTILVKNQYTDVGIKDACCQWYYENPARAQRFADAVKTERARTKLISKYGGLRYYDGERHEICEGWIPVRLNELMEEKFGASWMQDDKIHSRFWKFFLIGSAKQTPGRLGVNERRLSR